MSPQLGAFAGVLLLGVAWSHPARADEASLWPSRSPPVVGGAEMDALRSELGRQASAIDALQHPSLHLSGYVQVDWVLYNQASRNEIDYATNAPLNQDRFTLRRGHFRVDAEHRFLRAALEVDVNTTNGAQVRPLNAEIGVHWPEKADPGRPLFELALGIMKIPFGVEVPESDALRPFLERSTMARAFFPGEYDVGARFRAKYRFLEMTLSAMNGHPIGDRVFPALAPDQKKEVIGHLGVQTNPVQNVEFSLGISADTGNGFHEGTPTTKDELVWRDDNGDGIVQSTEIQVVAGSSARPSQEFHRFALGADARLAVSFAPGFELSLRGELVRASNLDRGLESADPVGAGHDLHELGWYVGLTQELTSWALLGVRYDRYDPDQDAREQQAAVMVPRDRSYSTLAFLAMLRYADARLALEYDHNHNTLGRNSSGAPARLANDALTVRGQLTF